MRSLRRWFYAAALLALSSHDLHAEDVKTFYTGKTIKLLVGLPPGGGADAYARLVQRHLGRFVPGAPQIVAQNMPGAGPLRSVMALTSSPDDGTAMLRNLYGVKLKQVQGYAGSADKRFAIERGEIDGDCGGWTSVPEEWLRDRKIS